MAIPAFNLPQQVRWLGTTKSLGMQPLQEKSRAGFPARDGC
jgi:hypothetical protein